MNNGLRRYIKCLSEWMKGLIKLKELREKAGITQQELADKLFISAQSVSKWENGQAFPRIDTFEKLCVPKGWNK